MNLGCNSNKKVLTRRDLIWAEEFDYVGLPKAEHWVFEEGKVRNKESQYYTKERQENVYVRKGKLYITARKEDFPNSKYEKGSNDWRKSSPVSEYTSGSINTAGLFAWKYGRIEVRAKLPRGKGVWPAIWMLGDNFEDVAWPHSGEIDIMEHVGKDPKTIHGTVHFPKGDGELYASDGGQIEIENLSRKFHIYAIEWNEETISFFVNEQIYHVFEIDQAGIGEDNPFRRKHFLLLNLALGGSWPGPIDDSIFPQKFVIDYVRVYQ
ncbi:family 16 glycosylhydrolase [Belliella kenyensis]|uniref:Family 16 glycosylhydrolase n=1 Tax=Belliella kenyensis TaxID=1472724 RepID=A0ABV8EHU8_9BACT|nr:glycoside hydrolase family 16 protein [Belliella kenyensis]MCH7401002.1 glycoside hydrolase family 16 protein [Belliella kenyensis]MDN3604000.1 glycoside hydrolase family 16 protein [Belliella kenyensis]